LNFVELNTVMVFISTVAGLAWRFLSEGYHQANIMREAKAAKKSAVEATLRKFVKEEYRPARKGKEISKAVNLRLVAAGFDEVKDASELANCEITACAVELSTVLLMLERTAPAWLLPRSY
jgi:hypothetical protein